MDYGGKIIVDAVGRYRSQEKEKHLIADDRKDLSMEQP
jgi:hypothetical protein